MKTKSAILAALVVVALTGCASTSPEVPTDVDAASVASEEPQKSATETAEFYLDTLPFSREGLIEILEYEGYSTEESTSAVDSLKVDWNAQVVAAAEDHLVSQQELEEHLEEFGFTPEEVAYALEKSGMTPATPEVLEEGSPAPTSGD